MKVERNSHNPKLRLRDAANCLLVWFQESERHINFLDPLNSINEKIKYKAQVVQLIKKADGIFWHTT